MAGRRKAPKKKIEIVVVAGAAEKFNALDYLATVAQHPDIDERTKTVAASTLASYQHTKAQLWVDRPINLPRSTTVTESAANIAAIAELARQKRISLDVADRLTAIEQAYSESKTSIDVEAQMLELRQQVQELSNRQASAPVETIILGGLPPLPGCDVIMPKPNRTPPSDGPKP